MTHEIDKIKLEIVDTDMTYENIYNKNYVLVKYIDWSYIKI